LRGALARVGEVSEKRQRPMTSHAHFVLPDSSLRLGAMQHTLHVASTYRQRSFASSAAAPITSVGYIGALSPRISK
jgi:hypothetical protein